MKSNIARVFSSLLLLLAVSGISQPVFARDVETVIFEVCGLWAQFCEWYLEECLLGDIAGIEAVAADYQADTVTVVFDPDGVSAEKLAAAIEDCPLMKVEDSPTHELDREEIRRQRRCCCCWLDRDR